MIDPAVGFVMRARLGDYVKIGDPIATLYARSEESAAQAEAAIKHAITFSETPAKKPPLIYAVITKNGLEQPNL